MNQETESAPRERASRLARDGFRDAVSLVYGGTLDRGSPGLSGQQQTATITLPSHARSRPGGLRSELQARLPWTILTEWPVDHYFGFHLLLAPFAALPSALWG